MFLALAQLTNKAFTDAGKGRIRQSLTALVVYVTGVMWSGNHLHQYCCDTVPLEINSLAPGKFEWNFKYVIFKWILVIDGWSISCEIALIWMSLDFTDDQSTLVQVMAWCRQATSHYLSQCWPRSLPPYGVTRPQWVNLISTHLKTGCHQLLTLGVGYISSVCWLTKVTNPTMHLSHIQQCTIQERTRQIWGIW